MAQIDTFEMRDVLVQTKPLSSHFLVLLPMGWVLLTLVVEGPYRPAGVIIVSAAMSMLAFFATLAVCLAWRARIWRSRSCTVRADSRGLWVEGRRLVRGGSATAAGLVTEDDARGTLSFGTRLRVFLQSRNERAALLAAMHLDACSVDARYYFHSGARQPHILAVGAVISAFAFSCSFLLTGPAVSLCCLGLLLLAMIALIRSVASIDVSSKGILVRRTIARPRLIVYSELEKAGVIRGQLILQIKHMAPVVLSFRHGRMSRAMGRDQSHMVCAFLERIRLCRRTFDSKMHT